MALDGAPTLLGELREWARLGLIPQWEPTTAQDVVLANVLRAIRHHLEVELEREYDGD